MADKRLYESLLATARADDGQFLVCGRVLRPLSLLHCVQLEAIESPLWKADAGKPTLFDLDVAAQICSSNDPVIPQKPDAAALRKRVLIRELGAWVNYIELCQARPELKTTEDATVPRDDGAPFELFIVTFLGRILNIPEDRAWRMPAGLAHWYFDAAVEQVTGEHWIIPTDLSEELDRLSTPAAKAERRAKEQIAGDVFRAGFDPELRLKLLADLETEPGRKRVVAFLQKRATRLKAPAKTKRKKKGARRAR